MGVIRDLELKSKEQVLANGSLIVTNFKNLNVDDFKDFASTQAELESLTMVCSIDGRAYINTRESDYDAIVDVYKEIIKASRYELDQQAKALRAILKGTYDKTERTHLELQGAKAYLILIECEIKRRLLERKYYKACK